MGVGVILDRVVPVSGTPIPAFALDSVVEQATTLRATGTVTVTSTTAATDLAWKATDANTITRYALERRAGTSWSSVALAKPTSTTSRQPVRTGSTSQYRVQATDFAGNTGAWKQTAQYALAPVASSSAWPGRRPGRTPSGSSRSTTTATAFRSTRC